MLRNVAGSLLRSSQLKLSLLGQYRSIHKAPSAGWPDPLTQQTLSEFLNDINYFEEPKKIVNIGLEHRTNQKLNDSPGRRIEAQDVPAIDTKSAKVDEILDLLSHETEPPALNYDDIQLRGEELIALATSAGIYRDLFGKFEPNRDDIKFTPEQAERMDKLVPYFWITDQPLARVDRHPRETEPLCYFNPLVGISAKFVHDFKPVTPEQVDELGAHVSYYGNIIPAGEALIKPSITLDGHLLSGEEVSDQVSERKFNNWTPGTIDTINFKKNSDKYYTVALVNLDYVHENASNLHWMLTNIKPSAESPNAEEVCDYLPVHGIRGFGYSRYVFLVLQHDSRLETKAINIDGFSLESRKFDPRSFLNNHKAINMTPVGLSWFQTTWDSTSNKVFHDYLKLKAPVYEIVQEKNVKPKEEAYPGKIPFNIFLDHYRNKKNINEQVLLERLKSVDPFDYKDQYVPPRVPPTVFTEKDIPSWMQTVMIKKKNKIGIWRGLRPASAILPLDNNSDLDHPARPLPSSRKAPPEYHNLFPGRRKFKYKYEPPLMKPVNEHEAVFVQDDHQNHLEKVKKMMKDFEVKK